MIVFGTRPEAIKLVPLIKEFKEHKEHFRVKCCVTSQHKHMLDQVLSFFKLIPDYNLNLMKDNQSLNNISSGVLIGLQNVIEDYYPEYIVVQGDTTTSFMAGLTAFYNKIQIIHIEAGLRSNYKYSPFPEEVNRKLLSHIADFHFAPTKSARENLLKEGIKKNIYVVGNTIIDSLLLTLKIIKSKNQNHYFKFFNGIDFSKRIILITGHRRESFGKPFKNICYAIKEISKMYPDIELVYPVHLNPNVRKPVFGIINDIDNIHLIPPLDYHLLVWLLNKSFLVLTDSGGIQEEAPSLGKPVLVLRDVTERTEGIESGTARLVGTDTSKIIKETKKLLDDRKSYIKMASRKNPYGNGTASKKIINKLITVNK